MRKKVLFVIDSLGCGGAEKSLVSMLPLLDHNKYDIDLMMISRGGVLEQYIPKEVTIIDYKPHNGSVIDKTIYRLFQIIFSIKLRIFNLFGIKRHGAELYWSSLKYAIKPLKQKYDIAVAYQQGFPTYYVTTKVNALKKITWINADITNVGYCIEFNKNFYNKVDYIVSVSTKLKNLIDSQYHINDKTIVVADIINPELIITMANENHIIPLNKLTLTTVARLVPPKGHYLAIEAANILKQNGIEFKWYFVGDGPLRNDIEQQISKYNLNDYVILLGEQRNPYTYIKACDIYVQTSLFEGFGITISEAKILRKPIISTNFTVVNEQLTHEQNGLITNMDSNGIANAIIRLINDTTLKDTLISNLKKEVNRTSITEPAKVMALFD